jgi:hypothetical protein
VFDEGKGLSTKEQQYDPTSITNEVRRIVDARRALPNPNQWQVTPETARLLQHLRLHKFSDIRPFFCQVEAAETAEKTSTSDRANSARTCSFARLTVAVDAIIFGRTGLPSITRVLSASTAVS